MGRVTRTPARCRALSDEEVRLNTRPSEPVELRKKRSSLQQHAAARWASGPGLDRRTTPHSGAVSVRGGSRNTPGTCQSRQTFRREARPGSIPPSCRRGCVRGRRRAAQPSRTRSCRCRQRAAGQMSASGTCLRGRVSAGSADVSTGCIVREEP